MNLRQIESFFSIEKELYIYKISAKTKKSADRYYLPADFFHAPYSAHFSLQI